MILLRCGRGTGLHARGDRYAALKAVPGPMQASHSRPPSPVLVLMLEAFLYRPRSLAQEPFLLRNIAIQLAAKVRNV